MITCPWCGTNYTSFQSNCDNCGGSLSLPVEETPPPPPVSPVSPPAPPPTSLAAPPPPPRSVPRNVLWRILLIDGWAIASLVFSLLGFIFGIVGTVLTLTLVAAFVGLPFAGLGLLFLVAGIAILAWRYQTAQRTVEVLVYGEAALGEVVDVSQNYNVQVNGRYPWTVTYRYPAGGREHIGKVTTLSRPDLSQQPGKPVYVLYMPDEPGQNTIYPSPYGYYGL